MIACLASIALFGGAGSSIGVRAADIILTQQTTDGAITMAKVPPDAGPVECSVVPYFGCFAAQGLLAEYARTRREVYLRSAARWARWYADHQNPDGTIFDYKGRAGAWSSTNHFDSSDSYAAVYLELLRQLYRLDPNSVGSYRESIRKAIAGIDLTMQPCGMTLAKPTYPVMYTMDNVETLQGLRAAAELERALGDADLAAHASQEADRMESAVDSMQWDAARSSYRAAVQVDGGKMEGLTQWYPDVMANLMAIAWLPPSERNRSLYRRLRSQFDKDIPASVHDANDLERLVWWGLAAKGAGDRSFLGEVRNRLSNFDRICRDGCDPGDLGHVAALSD